MGNKTEGRIIMSINIGGGELRELKPRILVLEDDFLGAAFFAGFVAAAASRSLIFPRCC